MRDVVIRDPPTVRTSTPTVDVLTALAEHRLDTLLVVDERGALRGAVEPQHFLATPSAAAVLLRDQVCQRRRRDAARSTCRIA